MGFYFTYYFWLYTPPIVFELDRYRVYNYTMSTLVFTACAACLYLVLLFLKQDLQALEKTGTIDEYLFGIVQDVPRHIDTFCGLFLMV